MADDCNSPLVGRYSLFHEETQGNVYLLDTCTGEVWLNTYENNNHSYWLPTKKLKVENGKLIEESSSSDFNNRFDESPKSATTNKSKP
jgi:hypothetical protein